VVREPPGCGQASGLPLRLPGRYVDTFGDCASGGMVMFTFESSIMIRQPVDEVFAFVSDLGNAPKWQKGVVQSRRASEGPLRVGTRFEEDVRILGRHTDTVCVVTVFDPPRQFAFRSTASGVVEYEGRFTCSPHEGGTRLDLSGKMQLKGLWRLVEPVFARETKTEIMREMEAIKRSLESEATTVPAA
jgi:hypothetical protein